MSQHNFQADARKRKRDRADKRFKLYGLAAITFALAFLLFFFVDIIGKGLPAFQQAEIKVTVHYSEATMKNYNNAVDRQYKTLVSKTWLRLVPNQMRDNPELMGTDREEWVLGENRVDQYLKGNEGHRLKSKYQTMINKMQEEGTVRLVFNSGFFSKGDSKLPENAGILASAIGSILVLLLTMLFAVPVGVMTAIYLEEFAPDNKLTQLIEVNINNLAAIPSILYGLLGLAIFINFMGVPRSSALVGGLTLALMTLPVIIIATRAALRAVPDSIREAAYGLGASSLQVVWHHVLPLAMPGILTGSIIGLAQAMGETAPLLIVGMMAYIPEAPGSIFEATTVLPAQIYTWSSESLRAFEERTAAGIMVLLAVLLTLNAVAVKFRNRSENTW
ncbi:phosphate ABC transporter permease PstA [Mariprofundus sp. KV]|uniref:phosphate ABC transporter permease PstA n=1 Tax=Mariprofundus sp. KV TaxID=2608715 RepID=UPI00159FCC10|nr:phosphate ABC transporter permease PstA [Mariprofundus sp. KV]NWF36860.1 phosphate ABC transporter permease PstA [Mariprofundus sp. KV]